MLLLFLRLKLVLYRFSRLCSILRAGAFCSDKKTVQVAELLRHMSEVV